MRTRSGGDLTGGIFNHLSKLRTLCLNDNNLVHLRESVFEGLKRLEILHLEYNNMKVIEGTAFFPLKHLQGLILKRNSFTTLTDCMFIGLRFLIVLDVSWNDLKSISIDAFATNSRLQMLHAEHNELTTIDARTYSFLPKLEILDFADNRISSIQRYPFKYHRVSLNLFGSKINCSCAAISSIMSLNANVRFASCILQEPFAHGYYVPSFVQNVKAQWSAWSMITTMQFWCKSTNKNLCIHGV